MNSLLPQLCGSETSGVINLMEILYKTKSLLPFETLLDLPSTPTHPKMVPGQMFKKSGDIQDI